MRYVEEVYTMTKDEYPYKGITDPKYIKDKKELFAKHCNGWYRYVYSKANRIDLLSDFDKKILKDLNYDVRCSES